MNHDPRKAIRQAMMIARREVTAPNKASIGGQRHILAYITPYEAELLMRRGGSGRLTEYGVPAFDDGPGDGPGGGDTSNADPGTQSAGAGNEGTGAGPTGAGAGTVGQDSQDDVGSPPGPPGGPNSGFGSSMTQDPEATQAAANMQTAVAAQQAGRGVGIADTGGAQPSGFGAAPGIGEAMEAYEQGVIGLAPALGYSAMSAFSPPGMQFGTVTDEVGNQTPGANVNIGGMIGGIAGMASGVPGAGMVGGMIGSQVADALGVPSHTFSFADGGAATGGRMDPRMLPGIHLKTNHRFADGGAVGQQDEDVGFDAYHGSPHEFEQFDIGKIGTGYGGQMYGHGLYFAEDENVARAYRDELSTPLGTKGQIYHVRVKADPEHFLDWDAPLSQQHPKTVEALNRAFPSAMDYWRSVEGKAGDSGNFFHRIAVKDISGDTGEGHDQVAKKFRDAGIPGIRYFDANSTPGDVTRNYVVFDHNLIETKRRYADGGEITPPRDLGADPTVQQALDLTRQTEVSPVAAARSVALGEAYGRENAPAYSQAGAEAGELPIGGGVSGSAGRISASHQAPLEGLPTRIKVPLTGEVVTAGPNHQVRAIAEQYMRDAGLPYNPPTKYAKVDAARAKRIADEYERMADDPDHPLVKAAYDAMIRETMAQYQAAKAAGFKAEFWDPEKERDPYEASPRLAIEDVNNNHHMYVFPTYFGYGSKEVPADAVRINPLLADSGERWNGYPVTVNDIFRAVHDYFGHAKEGVGFRHDGEENAWRSHASMYSPLARLAMTSETRGQNSWLNFGPHGEKNRHARTEDTVFADQKIGVMPPWTTHEGAEDFLRPEDRETMEKAYKQYRRAYGGRLGYADGGMMGDDPTVQRALDITRGAQPAAPDMARQAMGQSSKLASTFQAENRPAVIVSPRPGKIGGPPVQREAPEGLPKDFMQDRDPWTFATPNIIGASQPPPVQHPVFNDPRMEKITNATRQIFKNKDFHGLIRDLTGLQGLNITPTVGTWQNEMEPSFILSHPDMTDEHAEKLAHLLGFGFQQDAILQSKHNPDIESGAPAVLMGTGKKLTPSQIDDIHSEATKHGVDFTVTGDGKAAKFVHLGDQAGLEDFYGKIKNISDAAKLPELYHAKTTGKLIDAQSYLNGIFGSPGGEVRDQTGTGRSPDLFRRIVDHVLAPYAKAVAGEGYRLSPERLAETYALNDEESGHVRGALYPSKKDDRTTIPLMTGEEQLDVRPTGARGRASVGDVLYALQNRAASKGQIDPGDFSDNAKNDIAQNIAKEVAYHVQNSDKSAIGWYDDALKQAMSQYAGRFPELGTDPQKTMLFHAILGITSQGNDVYSNSIHAMRLYDQIQNGGKSLPEAIGNLKGSFGDKTRAIETNLLKLHHLLDTNGYDRMSDLFNQTKTVSEWNSILRQDKSLRAPNGEKLKVEGGSGQKVTGWMVFGPKIGSFINNLHGDYSTLTADLWFSRTWNRLLGHNFIHTPLAEAKQYRDFRDALRAEYYSSNPNIGVSPIPKTEDGKLVYDKKGRPEPWEYGSDAPALGKEEFDDLLNDPDKMLNFAQDITKRYRDSQFKDKSDLRRRAKNWIENRELPVAAPRGDLERQFQQDTVEEAQRLLKKKYGMNISVADIQAALWFHEKELFGKLGVASEKAQPADYADAARRTISLIDSGDLYRVKSKEKGKKAKPQEQFASGGMTPPTRDSAIVDRALRLTSSNRPMVALADLFQRQLRGRPPS
jgi:hypothetical protein